MILRRNASGWENTPAENYKNEPGTWMDVSRRILFESDQSSFQVRYFELGVDGYTSFEEHDHEHCVLVLAGDGEVFLEEKWSSIGEGDLVVVKSCQPHQFRNRSAAPFGILCIVDRERDRPRLLGNV